MGAFTRLLRTPLGAVALGLALLAFAPAKAVASETFGFTAISSNSSSNPAAQLSVEVSDAGSGQVDFKFTNVGSIASSITDIYFDDGTLLGISTITDSAGVAFSAPATPGNLPGGNNASPSFVTTAGFSADSDSPVSTNGVNNTSDASEWVTIRFNLIGGQTYADTLTALGDGSLRIGLHVQAIGTDGNSDAFVNDPNPIPEPSTMALAVCGIFGIGLTRLRRLRAKDAATL